VNPNMNVRAALDAEEVCKKALAAALADYGDGYVGAPRLTAGELAGVNCWWFAAGGGTTTRQAPNAPVCSLDMDARIEGVFADRHRAWEFAFTALAALPIKGGIVQTCYLNGNPSNEYEYFLIAGRTGKHGLWRASVPLRIVFNCNKGAGV
jgi:hypothetical protein